MRTETDLIKKTKNRRQVQTGTQISKIQDGEHDEKREKNRREQDMRGVNKKKKNQTDQTETERTRLQ